MPIRPKHCIGTWLLLENPYSLLHKAMDSPAKKFEKEHRKIGFHSIEGLTSLISYKKFHTTEDRNFWDHKLPVDLIKAGCIHIIQDYGINGTYRLEEELSSLYCLKGKEIPIQIRVLKLPNNWIDTVVDSLLPLLGPVLITKDSNEVKFLGKEDKTFFLFMDCTNWYGFYDTQLMKRIERCKLNMDLSLLALTPDKYEPYQNNKAKCFLPNKFNCEISYCKYQ